MAIPPLLIAAFAYAYLETTDKSETRITKIYRGEVSVETA
jgi:hypothetical protein